MIVNTFVSGEIAERYAEFQAMCRLIGKTPEQRLSELALGDLLLWQKTTG